MVETTGAAITKHKNASFGADCETEWSDFELYVHERALRQETRSIER